MTGALLVGLAVVVAIATTSGVSRAAPALQVPWPTGQQHRIYGGSTYGCDLHTTMTATSGSAYNADYYGIDFQAGSVDGSPLDVSAGAAGQVILRTNANDGYGNKVVLDHGGGFYSVYAHFQDGQTWGPGIVPGLFVSQGQVLGYAGGTGADPLYPVHIHVHMQLELNAYRAEPLSNVTGFGSYGYSVEALGCGTHTAESPYWWGRAPAVRNLLDHASFEDGATDPIAGQSWDPINGATANVLATPSPFAGAKFLQTGGSGGSVIQTIPLAIAPGESYVFSVWARIRQGFSGGTAGTLRLKAQGAGGPLEFADKTIVVTSSWSVISTSVDLIHSHSELYAEILLNLSKPIDLDATEVIQVMLKKASFEASDYSGAGKWQFTNPEGPPAGVTNHSRKSDSASKVGPCYLELYKTEPGTLGSIYQDINTVPASGDSFQFTAWLRRGSGSGTRTGKIVLWALGGSPESSTTYFVLPDTTWRQWSVTLEPVSGSHTSVRAEIYLLDHDVFYQLDGARVFNNQLQKTSFQSGAIPSWGGANLQFNVATVTDAKDSTKQLNMYATAVGGYLQHVWPVDVKAQDSLTFTIWARCRTTCSTGSPISGQIVISGLGSEQYYTLFNLTSTTTWVPIIATLDVATSGTQRWAKIEMFQQNREIAVDAVSNSTGSGG